MLAALHLAPPDIAVLSCQKVSQVIGEIDRQRKVPTENRTESRFGLKGTDLGASFEHEGKLVFLFGDTWPVGPHTPDRPVDGDSLAFCRDTNSDRGLTLDFVKAADGRYATIRLPNVSNGAFEVPNGGFSHDGWMHVFYTTDARFEPYGVTMGRCVLIRSRDGLKWELVYTVSTDKFINVAPVEVDCAKIEGLPQKTGKGLLLWASGREYRRSSPCLAFIPLDKLADRNQMRYWTGKDWSIREEEARPLFHHPMVGEISVAYCDPLKCWLMTYNVEQPRSVLLRAADSPLGPWSDAKILTTNADALGRYMHAAGKRDGLSDPGREDQNGDFYGPYLIPRFFKGDRREATIDFLLSTWNPYAVMLMRARLRLEGDAPDLPLR